MPHTLPFLLFFSQVVAAPYIQDNSGSRQGLWLGLYFTAIPFGTCIGYGYGAILAS